MINLDWSGTLRPLRDAFLLVVIGAALLTLIILLVETTGRLESFSLSFLASLWEDILFFLAIGLALFVVQRQERERSRTLADRLFILCNARDKLSDNERDSLKELISNILSYIHYDRIEIRIEEYRESEQTLETRIVRDITFANYTTDMEASHAVHLKLVPTGVVDGRSISLDSVESVEIPPREKGDEIQREVLLAGKDSTTTIDEQLKPNKIGGGKHRLYEIRYTSWVDLTTLDGLFYELTTRKYTKDMDVIIYNHSRSDLSVKYKRGNGQIHHLSLKKDTSTKEPITFSDLRAGETCEFRLLARNKSASQSAVAG